MSLSAALVGRDLDWCTAVGVLVQVAAASTGVTYECLVPPPLNSGRRQAPLGSFPAVPLVVMDARLERRNDLACWGSERSAHGAAVIVLDLGGETPAEQTWELAGWVHATAAYAVVPGHPAAHRVVVEALRAGMRRTTAG